MIDEFISKNSLQKYRIKQFNEAYYQKLIESFDELTTWLKELREKLSKEIQFISLIPEKTLISSGKDVYKVLFSRKSDGKKIETVLMRFKDGRNTVCVSCMVGCPVGCTFCATGKMGFKANLETNEIVDQVLYFARMLKNENQRISNVVYMGMGEPMLNLENVKRSIEILTDQDKFALGQRRITVSTSSYINQLIKFIDYDLGCRLAISLHAQEQKLREIIMPTVAKVFPLEKLFNVLDFYTSRRNKRVSYEYILIKDFNDQMIHAEKLAELLKNRLSHVNLIPINPTKGSDYQRPSNNQVFKFAGVLKKHNIPYTIRITMGDDIKAACGQLSS